MMTNFACVNGGFVGLDGRVFIPSGVCILESSLPNVVSNASCTPLLANFPGTNMVRIAMESGYGTLNNAPFVNAIKWLTDKGIVVQVGNYNRTQSEMTGAELQQACGWFATMATRYKDNPLVWFSTENEPLSGSGASIGAEQQAVYRAIRAVSEAHISCALAGGSSLSGMDASIYPAMHNVSWEAHYYNWLCGKSADLTANRNALANVINGCRNFARSADGVMPCFISEWGDATDGNHVDAGWRQVCQAVLESPYGQTAWIYYFPGAGADALVNISNGQITEYGRLVAAAIAQRAGANPPAPPGPPAPPVVLAESRQGTEVGIFTDGAIVNAYSETFTITAAGQVAVNGKADTATSRVTTLVYADGKIHQRNGSALWWAKPRASAAWTTASDPRPATTARPPTEAKAALQAQMARAAATGADFQTSLDALRALIDGI